MEEADSTESPSASALIDKRIAELADWRGETLSVMRKLIRDADPDVEEEVKWRKPSNSMLGVSVWSHQGIICTGETYKDKVKFTFARGARDPVPFCAREVLRIAIALLVALLGQAVTAEVPPVEPSDVQIAVLEPGLPDFPPLEKRGLEDPYVASIASEASEAGEIIVVVGTERGKRSIWLLQRSAGVVNLGSVNEGWNPVEIDIETEKQRLLHLAVADPRRELRYAWGAVVYPSGFIEGEMAPELEASRLAGELFELSGLRGRTVVLNWWAIWCLPCVEEIPELNELAGEYAQRPVDFIAIADNQKADVLQFLESREFLYQQAVSLAGTAEVMGRRFPRHIVVAPDGRVVFNISGYGAGSVESLREALALLLE